MEFIGEPDERISNETVEAEARPLCKDVEMMSVNYSPNKEGCN